MRSIREVYPPGRGGETGMRRQLGGGEEAAISGCMGWLFASSSLGFGRCGAGEGGREGGREGGQERRERPVGGGAAPRCLRGATQSSNVRHVGPLLALSTGG